MMLVRVYADPHLPLHWVGEDESGELYIFPCDPMTPDAWKRREPFRGYRQSLEPAFPPNLVKFYQETGLGENG